MNSMEQRRLRFEVKLPLILIHTPFGLQLFDKIARTKAGRLYSKFNVYLMPVITVLALILISGSLMVFFANAAVREGVRDIGPQANLLIPGLNPYLPITYGWVALIITIIIHEAGHGIVARVHNVKVDSTGLLLFVGIPVGAFVNIQKEELERASLKQKSAILTAGPINNMIIAGVSLFALFLVISTLTPISTGPDGIAVLRVEEGSIAESIGLTEGSVVHNIAGQDIRSIEELSQILQSNLGNTIEIFWVKDGETVSRTATLPTLVEEGKGILGIYASNSADPDVVLQRYRNAFMQNPLAILLPPTLQQNVVPYSDLMASSYTSNVFGQYYYVVANMLFWLWFVNFNVGLFNALPIVPLDGGQLYKAFIDKKVKSQILAKNMSIVITVAMIGLVIGTFVMPYLSF